MSLAEIEIDRIAIKVRPAGEKMVKRGHPWIFSDSIIKQSKEGKPGDLAVIFDSKTNNFLACGLFDPASPIKIKVLQFGQQASIDSAWFVGKIDAAFAKRKQLLETDTNSYRLVFGENDGLPGLIADVYANELVIKLYSAIWIPYLEYLLDPLMNVSGCKTCVLRLSRNTMKVRKYLYELSDGQILLGELKSEIVHFVEHGINFSANVISGHKTGYFLDHRHNRKRVGEMASGQTVLDVFSYAGGFSVHALANGAREVVSVDISQQALEAAQYNASLNEHSGEHKTMKGDAFGVMEQLIETRRKFGVVVIDPPSFAKSQKEVPKALVAYSKLATLGVKLVSDGGLLVLASCSSRVSSEDFFRINEEYLEKSGRYFETELQTQHDIDHPIGFDEGAYLKCGYYRFYD